MRSWVGAMSKEPLPERFVLQDESDLPLAFPYFFTVEARDRAVGYFKGGETEPGDALISQP